MGLRYALPLHTRQVGRTMDVARLNTIANDPSVRPGLGGDGPLDLAPVVANPSTLAFETDQGGALLCEAIGAGRYGIHSLFLPAARGREAFCAMREVAGIMFGETDCTEGRTTVVRANRASAVAARFAGFECRYPTPILWTGGVRVEADLWSLTIEHWALTAPGLLELGRWFHTSLEDAKEAAGSARVTHADDEAHDRIVGATIRMLQGGQARKAVAFYNVQAAGAGWCPITLVRTDPTIVDMGDAIIEARPGEMEVLTCR